MAVADSAGSYTATATIDGQAETSESYMLEVGPKLGVWARVFGRDRKSRFVEGLWGPLAFGGVLVVGYGICQASCAVLMVAAAVGSAAFVAGALVGFLFGIPRSLTSETAPLGPPVGGTVDPKAPQYRPNTNLEQVSDWLTKILLGAGLAQMHSIVTGFGNLVDGLVPAMGADGFARAFAGAEIIYFVIAGFLSGYLLTRLRLQRELELHAE
jgi:hypothetical protein